MMKASTRISLSSTTTCGLMALASDRATGPSATGVSHPATTAKMNPNIPPSCRLCHPLLTISTRPPQSKPATVTLAPRAQPV